jgi:hypothetical protein
MSLFTSRIEEMLLEGVAAGFFRSDLASKDTARYLIALFQGLMMRWSVFDFEYSIEKEGQQVWRFFDAAIRVNPPVVPPASGCHIPPPDRHSGW